jgi:hypothetical protein
MAADDAGRRSNDGLVWLRQLIIAAPPVRYILVKAWRWCRVRRGDLSEDVDGWRGQARRNPVSEKRDMCSLESREKRAH